ncbi:hypothetical protein [Halorubrum vacuolatum]|uniref:Uncharacterized protein n=1 Tax=Halorubrum vacuolatum TaxID=63740 RepID=A0A238XS86_HALVU|nr:hypothetical protein [Halorubrum vacuolatum]SNR61580.1 hypothetical protein SAMN06264855_1223 [Halorubrum vacuolatum]
MPERTSERVLTILADRPITLPEDLTLSKIRDRAFGFKFEEGEELSFRIERHPTMYLSGMGVPGIDASPARFHVLTEYRLDLNNETWDSEELASSFEYEPWLVVEAELGAGGPHDMIQQEITEVRAADDPEAAFDDVFGSWIDHWEEKFAEVHGRAVPQEDKEAILDLLVGELRERADLD